MIRLVNWPLRILLGAVFVFAGALKIFDPVGFAENIEHYRLLPHDMINLVAMTLPWIELIAGLMLIMGFWIRASAGVITLLCLAFLVAIGQALARGLDISCGCFGTVEASKIGAKNLLLDLACLTAGVWLVWKTKD
jgi:uncharacterized membrane protein YphA (DoxX/SURF4 family)